MNELELYGKQEKTMTTKEVASALNVDEKTIQRWTKRLFPENITNGKTTNLTEVQVTAIKNQIGTGRNDLDNIVEVKKVETALEKKHIVVRAIQILNEEMQELERQLAAATPKVEAFDAFISSENLISVGEAAQVLKTGRNRLFQELRNAGILKANNLPYQEYIDRGYFEVKENPVQMGEKVAVVSQCYFTTKGMEWYRKK